MNPALCDNGDYSSIRELKLQAGIQPYPAYFQTAAPRTIVPAPTDYDYGKN